MIRRKLLNAAIAALCVLCTVSQSSQAFHRALDVQSKQITQDNLKHRVNVPYGVTGEQAAIFWFGRVKPNENYIDVRIGYLENILYVHVHVFDRRLWYDTSPTAADLTQWDSSTLYLDLNGPVGDTLDANSYRFDAQLYWLGDAADYRVAYQGDAGGWSEADISFTAKTGWNGSAPNDNQDDRDWSVLFRIPYDSLGLSAPPAKDTVWGIALAVHDRDSESEAPLPDQHWPESFDQGMPDTWAELSFGLTEYSPPPALPEATRTIRQGLDGATVMDADVGGSSNCGDGAKPNYFDTWGELNYAKKEFVNIQNVAMMDWPCASKYYVTFPLDTIPNDRVVISATLTMYQFGNAGQGWIPEPQPSLVQVLTVEQAWDEDTLTWNNAPLAVENIATAWVDPVDETPDWPGIPHQWNVSQAASQAHKAGEPLRLVIYDAYWNINGGKYFWSSDVGGSGEGRPSLNVTWGQPTASIAKSADRSTGVEGESITYRLDLSGMGKELLLTDTLSSSMAWTGELQWSGTNVMPSYDKDKHHITWQDTLNVGESASITYTVTIATDQRKSLINTVQIQEKDQETKTSSVTLIANPSRVHLPIVLHNK